MKNPLNSKITGIQPSGIRKFFDIVADMKDAISLGVGEPDFDTPWHIREEGIHSLERGRTFYTSNAGLKEVPVIVRDYTEEQILKISLIENMQRKDLNPIEEALAYKRLQDEFGRTQDEIAESMSKSRVAITNTMRLLNLTEKVQEMVVDERISSGHARALLAIEDPEEQYNIALKVFDEKWSVREIEKYIKNRNKPKKEEQNTELDFIFTDLEEKLKIALGTKVAIHAKDKEKGKIEIEYYSKEDLERLTDIFMGTAE